MEDIKVLKLVSGETIVALTTRGDSYIKVDNPIEFRIVASRGGYGSMIASEWLQTEQTSFKIKGDHIVAMAPPTKMLLEYYFNTINEINEPDETEQEYIERMTIESFIANTGTVTIH